MIIIIIIIIIILANSEEPSAAAVFDISSNESSPLEDFTKVIIIDVVGELLSHNFFYHF